MAQHWLDSGVLLGISQRLAVTADNTGMQVKVAAGAAWLNGQFYESDTVETLPIGSADPTNPRIDRVVVRNDYVANTSLLMVVQGVAAPTPTAPSLVVNTGSFEISLATVNVAAGVTSLLSTAVFDDRSLVASTGGRFEPGLFSTAPSRYPAGVTVGTVNTADGWPVTGVHVTARRGSRVSQRIVQTRTDMLPGQDFNRHGTASPATGVDGFAAAQAVRLGSDVQRAEVGTSETTTSTAYGNLVTAGPSVTVTVGPSGRVQLNITADIANNTAGAVSFVSVETTLGTALAGTDSRALVLTTAAANDRLQATRSVVLTGLAAGQTTFRLTYRVTAGTGTFRFRSLTAEAI